MWSQNDHRIHEDPIIPFCIKFDTNCSTFVMKGSEESHDLIKKKSLLTLFSWNSIFQTKRKEQKEESENQKKKKKKGGLKSGRLGIGLECKAYWISA